MIRRKLSALFARRSARASAVGAASLLLAILVAVLFLQRAGSGEARGEAERAIEASSVSPASAPRASREGALLEAATALPRALAAPAPPGLSVEVRREGKHQVRVFLRRPGHLVTVSRGDQREVGRESASIRLPYAAGPSLPELAWETAEWSSLAVARGALRLVTDAWGALGGVPSLVDAPAPVTSLEGRLHRCVAHADGAGGFTVHCKLQPGAWRIGAANLTGDDPRGGVWLVHGAGGPVGPDAFVRFDIPLLLGSVEARLAGYLEAATGTVIRAEASRLPGEEPRIVLSAASQKQPVIALPPIPKRRLKRLDMDFF